MNGGRPDPLLRLFAGEDGRIRAGWKVLGLVVLSGLLADLVRSFAPGALAGSGDPWFPREWVNGALLLLATGFCLRAERQGFASTGLALGRRWAAEAGLGFLLGLLLITASALAARACGAFHWVRTPGAGLGGLAAGLWLYAAVAFNEELLFRGYAFFRLRAGLGAALAILLTSAAFAAAHWDNPGMSGATRVWACVNIGLAGLLLGLAAWRTGSLALPMGLHLGWNWAQGSLLGFGVSGTDGAGLLTPVFDGRPDWLSGGSFGLEASLPCAILCAAACVMLWRWPRRATPLPEAAPPTDPGGPA